MRMDIWIGNKKIRVVEKKGKHVGICPVCSRDLETTRYEDVRTGYFLCDHGCFMKKEKEAKP